MPNPGTAPDFDDLDRDIADHAALDAEEYEPEEASLLERLQLLVRGGEYRINLVNYFLAGGIVSIAAAAVLIHQRLQDIDALLNAGAGETVASQVTIYDAFSDITTIAMVCFAGFIIYTCLIALYLGHRVSQPMTELVESIDAYRQGNYEHKPDLAPDNLLHPISDALSALRARLQNPKASR